MIKIIRQREVVFYNHYKRSFQREDKSGYMFECDKDGNINLDALKEKPIAYENYLKCLANPSELNDCGVIELHWHYNQPAIGECHCGEEIILDRFTNTCEHCNRDYNSSGQELATREQWGECEGDSLSDILSVDSISTDQLFE